MKKGLALMLGIFMGFLWLRAEPDPPGQKQQKLLETVARL